MPSQAMTGYKTKFRVETIAGNAQYQALAEVTSLTPPNSSTDVIDVTHMESEDSTREFIQGFTDPGETSLEMNWIPSSATDAFILAWRSSRERRSCQIEFPNGVIWTFTAFVTSYQPDASAEEAMTASLTLKVTGSTTIS